MLLQIQPVGRFDTLCVDQHALLELISEIQIRICSLQFNVSHHQWIHLSISLCRRICRFVCVVDTSSLDLATRVFVPENRF